ncbi:MAG: hypothetical protein JWL61_2117 [Gemmatimonadetes bacterium]|nr:hypothetical protein [Gemmatimonadota bacterium]
MMDLGYPVVRPDIVLTSLFLKFGWLHHADASLPALRKIDLHGKGQFGARFRYDKPRMFKLVIDTARQVVATLNADELQADIGWMTANPLREFDLFMVKAGQKPEAQYGLLTTVEYLED